MSRPLDPPLGADDHVCGPSDAPLVLVMYGDFQCPYCAAAQGPLRRVRARLQGRLRFAFRHFPIVDRHPDAQRAAEAAEAAAAQGAFWGMHDALFAADGRLGDDDLAGCARAVGLDAHRLLAEVDDRIHAQRVARDLDSGLRNGVRGTPTFFANGLRHGGAFDARSLVEALAPAGGAGLR